MIYHVSLLYKHVQALEKSSSRLRQFHMLKQLPQFNTKYKFSWQIKHGKIKYYIVTVYMLKECQQVPEPWHVNVFLGSVKIFWCRTMKGNISTFIHMDIQILYLGILYDIVTDDNKAMGGSVLELSW